MGADTYLCHQCQNIFRLPADDSTPSAIEVKCPRCGSTHIDELPSWVPIGSNLPEGPPVWEYECQQCRKVFKLPAPGSPSQEKEIRCPACASGHIHRLTSLGAQPLYCG
jgi:putative FmdB family regulatory protein